MQALKLLVRAFCVLAFLTGAADMIAGVRLLIVGGARLGGVARDPVLNSQVAFWGAMWFGFGVVLWRTSANLRAEASLFRVLCAIIVLAGVARCGAARANGLPGPALTVAMIVELLAGTGLYLWHAALFKDGGNGNRPRTDPG